MKAYLSPVLFVLISLFYSCDHSPVVIIETSTGNIEVKLYPDKAPLTTANFLYYVEHGLYDGACFYRIVRYDNQPEDSIKIEVIQGGLYNSETDSVSPVQHERTDITGIRHKSGTISMARMEPGTATSEFFITIGDQPSLDAGGMRNRDGQGFAAFGRVTRGMKTVRRIHSMEAPGQYLPEPLPIISIRIME